MLRAAQACDEFGLDTISTGNLVGAVIEGYETGILNVKDLDEQPITWGDEEAILELMRKIAKDKPASLRSQGVPAAVDKVEPAGALSPARFCARATR